MKSGAEALRDLSGALARAADSLDRNDKSAHRDALHDAATACGVLADMTEAALAPPPPAAPAEPAAPASPSA